MDKTYLQWPFFEQRHRDFQHQLQSWSQQSLDNPDHNNVDAACRQLVGQLGKAGWLKYCVPAAYGGEYESIESRSVCLARETLAYHDGLADFSFVMQGLGSGPIALAGSEAVRQAFLPDVASGKKIAAFALSEAQAGSDVAAMKTRATKIGDQWSLQGSKTWISNGGIADFYTVFARTSDEAGARGISAFVVPAETAGLKIAGRIDIIAPHPLATLEFDDCRVADEFRLGDVGQGFKLAMMNLDIFRSSVAAAALGFARRAFDEGLTYAKSRPMFGQHLADFQMTQAALAEMACEVDASALLTYRAAWQRDVLGTSTTREAAMAKMTATESAQRIVDRTVQLFGGLGVQSGHIAERLYREVRALRIYEGATEVQKLIIARELLKSPD
ncbi:MAG: acyl-CoA dehydrogenase family protein [Burkholderiaceae bacterium]